MSKIILIAVILAVVLLSVNAKKPKDSKDDGKLVALKLKKKSTPQVHDVLKELRSELVKVKTRAKHMKNDRKTIVKVKKAYAERIQELLKKLRQLKRDGQEVRKEKLALKKLAKANRKQVKRLSKQLKHRKMKAHKRGKGHKKRGMKKRGKHAKPHKRGQKGKKQ